jgi:hypothetical protein
MDSGLFSIFPFRPGVGAGMVCIVLIPGVD